MSGSNQPTTGLYEIAYICSGCGDPIPSREVLCRDCARTSWQPFPETSPHPGSRVLVRSAANNIYVAWLYKDAWHTTFHQGCLGDDDVVITHWQPLPPPPPVEPFTMTYSGFTVKSPVNIAVPGGSLFQIHAENPREVQRLVDYLNTLHGEYVEERKC